DRGQRQIFGDAVGTQPLGAGSCGLLTLPASPGTSYNRSLIQGQQGSNRMGELVFPASYVVRQTLSGHSLASDFIRKAFYDAPGERERNFFADALAQMVEAAQGQDPSGLFRDVLIWDAGGRPMAFDVDLSNGQFMGAARFVDIFKWGYEPEILALLAKFLGPDDVLFDIGSNWG